MLGWPWAPAVVASTTADSAPTSEVVRAWVIRLGVMDRGSEVDGRGSRRRADLASVADVGWPRRDACVTKDTVRRRRRVCWIGSWRSEPGTPSVPSRGTRYVL